MREGKGLSASLQQTKVFPELAIEMIEVGESTGALPQMLNSVAEFFEEDVQTNLTAAMSLIEPAILIVMGRGGDDDFDCAVSADLQLERGEHRRSVAGVLGLRVLQRWRCACGLS